jgi:hypothetical protein
MILAARAAVFVSSILFAAPGSAQTHLASGTITQHGQTLELKSAVAVWDPEERAVLIGLFPFEVDDRDVRIAVTEGAQALAALRQSPSGAILLRLKGKTTAIELPGVDELVVVAKDLAARGKTFSVNRRTAEQLAADVTELSGRVGKDGGEVKLLIAGSDWFSSGHMLWNVRVSSPVYVRSRRGISR